ncbi:MAG: SLC13/DASS family transporter [Planctomycetes bacterium]|nr:SLC13/DASS family transporter [Planctomycetota bacterium]MCB9825298.1 SLC13/DASS family transporter [Planctomycetota bacterium]MCB9828765.1 SLC13/DASS family transporter [Planctomycetota bacterium]MCB9900784.1 SLC13/DASS family transporter [Planctomycetota bacterium]
MESRLARNVKRVGLVAGPALGLLLYALLPQSYRDAEGSVVALGSTARATLGMMVWMAVWWMTEAVEIEVTALLPIVAFPLVGVLPLKQTTASYGSDVVFLFLGGFILAKSLSRWGLDRRIALVTLRCVGTRPSRVVGGLMLATAVMSMWVSNTATVAMMVPIVLSLIDVAVRKETGKGLAEHGAIPEQHADLSRFALGALLGVAYAASIGGVGTIIGSPPNGLLARFLEERQGVSVGFAEWMLFGVPVVVVFLPLAWLLLVKVLFPSRLREIAGGREYVREAWARIGPLGRGERVTMIVFFCAAFAWMTSPWLARLDIAGLRPLAGLSDAGIAVGAALVLFVVPVDRKRGLMVMDWATAKTLPWGVLVLFGGGLALATAVEVNGVGAYVGSLAAGLAGWPVWAVLLVVIAAMVFLSELTSNTAQVATMLPILAALAPALDMPPPLLLVPATLAASLAFMMPVGTPPNAIVFGTGLVRMPHMLRAGLRLNVIGIVVLFVLTWVVIQPLLGRWT